MTTKHLFCRKRPLDRFSQAIVLLLCFTSEAFLFGQRQSYNGIQLRPLSFVSVPVAFYSKMGDEDEEDFVEAVLPSNELPLSPSEVESLTVSALKQQLRLRGLKVTGRKSDLVERLLQATGFSIGEEVKNKDKEFVDVSAFLDEEDVGKYVKTISGGQDVEEEDNPVSASEPEVWGTQARIVEEYEGRRIVVDSLTENVVEFIGSNQSYQLAYVVATRDALKPFLAGGANSNQTKLSSEEKLQQIQTNREKAARRPVSLDDMAGLDEGDETGIFENVLQRDYSDWGKYTPTGAQISATEVAGVLLLSDVYGAFTEDTKTLAAKIAFECQPIVVMVPDLFNGNPWTGPIGGANNDGQSYETWRATHSDLQVSINIRAAAACLRERYGVSSVVLWGTCYGGGRALEAAVGWLPNGIIHDIDGRLGPPPVEPMAVVAWYPTRYDARALFGAKEQRKDAETSLPFAKNHQMAVMGVFAENDNLPGASPKDAELLRSLLSVDERIKDHMVKVFPGQEHGFAHIGMSESEELDESDRFLDDEFGGSPNMSFGDRGDAEVACLLSTAFMETYSRVFLPTVGPPISLDDQESNWGRDIAFNSDLVQMARERDIRSELQFQAENFVEEPLGGIRVDPTDDSQEAELAKLLAAMQSPDIKDGPLKIEPDDDLPTIYAKLASSDDFEIF
jgi:dienelactone hydrolase